MEYLFKGCVSLQFLPDISKWNTSNVEMMDKIFKNCESLVYIPNITKWNLKNLQRKNNLFEDCFSLLTKNIISEKIKQQEIWVFLYGDPDVGKFSIFQQFQYGYIEEPPIIGSS